MLTKADCITQRIKQKGIRGMRCVLLSIGVFSWDSDVLPNPFRFHTLIVMVHTGVTVQLGQFLWHHNTRQNYLSTYMIQNLYP